MQLSKRLKDCLALFVDIRNSIYKIQSFIFLIGERKTNLSSALVECSSRREFLNFFNLPTLLHIKMRGGHPYLAKLSNQVFLPHIKYDLSKLLPEYGEFNEMMGIIIHGVPRRFQSSRWRKWPDTIQKSQNRCIFVLSVWKRHDKKNQ